MSNGDQLPPVGPGFFSQTENDAKAIAKLQAEGRKESGIDSTLWSRFWSSIADGIAWVITQITRGINHYLALLTQFFTAAQGEKNPEFWDLVAGVTEDMLGVKVDAAELKASFFASGRINAMEKVGAQVFDLLAQEFVTPPDQVTPGLLSPHRADGIGGLPSFKITPEQGVEAARRFMGFGMTFAVREGNAGFLSSLLPFGIGSGFRDYGESMVANLAIGRLMRIALRPLMTVLIADPLTQAMNKQYRPKQLSEGQLLAMFHHFPDRQAEVVEQLALLGFSDHAIQVLLEVEKTHIVATDVELLERFGVLSHADAVAKLTAAGHSHDDAELQLKVIDLRRLDVLVRAQAEQAQKLFVDGVYSSDQLRAALESLPITDDEKHLRQVLAATTVENPTKFLTLAEMQSALTQGVITVGELDDFLIRERFSADDQTILRLLSLLKTAKAEEAAAAAAARVAAKAAKEEAAEIKRKEPT